ncbi:MAG TPA: nuclear transport factor 2 family protein [Devosiaceae bacterium]|jgi:ketosteroid isomerase-like protein|nr:nuclear transport factor 2 family protein [Devosiaceae bacterium]
MKSGLKERVRAYLKALEVWDSAAVAAFYAEDVVQIEHPNQLKPGGDRRGLQQMLRDLERGRGLLQRQSYEARALLTEDDSVVALLSWKGVLAVPLGGMQPGAELQAESAVHFRFRDGLVVEQQNYDCVAPLTA